MAASAPRIDLCQPAETCQPSHRRRHHHAECNPLLNHTFTHVRCAHTHTCTSQYTTTWTAISCVRSFCVCVCECNRFGSCWTVGWVSIRVRCVLPCWLAVVEFVFVSSTTATTRTLGKGCLFIRVRGQRRRRRRLTQECMCVCAHTIGSNIVQQQQQ